MLCVHIGPGPLGLGLVVDQVSEAGFDICLVGPPSRLRVGRERTAERRSYGLGFTSPEQSFAYRDVRWAESCASAEHLPATVRTAISSDESVLITSALGSAISDRVGFIEDLVAMRPLGSETVLLPCENDPAAPYAELARRVGDRLQVCEVVVDRICSWAEPKFDDFRRRMVRAHDVGEWIIAGSQTPTQALTKLSAARLVSVVRPPIEGWKYRKLWVVNGLHIALGLLARVEHVDKLPLSGQAQMKFVDQAQRLCEQMGAGIQLQWPEVPVDNSYLSERIRAFCESPDYTERLLKKYLVRHDLRAFMTRLDLRLGDAARAAANAGEDCVPFSEVMSLVEQVLRDPSVYYPDPEQRGPNVERDAEVVQLWQEVLQGWMPKAEIDARVRSVELALEDQRDVLGPEVA